jgi:hypothetical protein
MTPEQEFKKLFERMYELCQENDWGDPFSYARSREIHIAGTLGHEISPTLSGADGIDEVGECEYKSTIAEKINGTYNGISVQPSWARTSQVPRREEDLEVPPSLFCPIQRR